MTLRNAYKGVKKLLIAEILQIIAIILLLIGLVAFGAIAIKFLGSGQVTDDMGGMAAGGLLSMCGGLVLPIFAFILSLVGLKQASKDEPDYMNKAYLCAIWALIFAIINACLQGMDMLPGLAGFCDFVSNVLEICLMVFSIMGVSEVTQNISRQDVADMGPVIITISVIAMIAGIIASWCGALVGDVAAIVSPALMLVAYIVYVVFLARATSALKKG